MELTPVVTSLSQVSNCPAVVIGLMGDLIEIGATVYTDGPHSDYLFSSGRMRLDYHKDTNVLRIARAFKAVKLALTGLREYYEQLKIEPPPKPNIQHLFPSPVPEPSWQGNIPRITFTNRLSRTGRPFILLDSSVANPEVLADDRRSGCTLPLTTSLKWLSSSPRSTMPKPIVSLPTLASHLSSTRASPSVAV